MSRVPLPPRDAKVVNTVCQFCIVGCGYKVYRWPEGTEGGPAPTENALGADFRTRQPALGKWVAPSMHTVVQDRDKKRMQDAG